MKKLTITLVLSFALALTLGACSQGASSSGAASSSDASSSEATANMANPWSDVASAEEAAAGAGLDSFSVPVGMECRLGPIDEKYAVFRCMDGIAEVQFPVGAVEMTIRKGTAAAATDGDISGDYNDYANTWGYTVGDRVLTCRGNRAGESTKTTWEDGDTYYCILAYGAGGDTDFGLTEEDLDFFVPTVQ